MKTDIILSGVGGQGILSIAAVIGQAAVNSGLYMKQAEVHGMSQRGGSVYSHLRLSDRAIASDLIPLGEADLILSVEPMEALRYTAYLATDGWIVTSVNPFINIEGYPDPATLMHELSNVRNRVLVDADQLAADCGSVKASNMVMLGAATPFLNVDLQEIEKAITSIFARKGDAVAALNICALHAGFEEAVWVQSSPGH
jgi:indolepyruvate ferredoxin oxidoreductase beta subunit